MRGRPLVPGLILLGARPWEDGFAKPTTQYPVLDSGWPTITVSTSSEMPSNHGMAHQLDWKAEGLVETWSWWDGARTHRICHDYTRGAGAFVSMVALGESFGEGSTMTPRRVSRLFSKVNRGCRSVGQARRQYGVEHAVTSRPEPLPEPLHVDLPSPLAELSADETRLAITRIFGCWNLVGPAELAR
jgi:hypothetical protein